MDCSSAEDYFEEPWYSINETPSTSTLINIDQALLTLLESSLAFHNKSHIIRALFQISQKRIGFKEVEMYHAQETSGLSDELSKFENCIIEVSEENFNHFVKEVSKIQYRARIEKLPLTRAKIAEIKRRREERRKV